MSRRDYFVLSVIVFVAMIFAGCGGSSHSSVSSSSPTASNPPTGSGTAGAQPGSGSSGGSSSGSSGGSSSGGSSSGGSGGTITSARFAYVYNTSGPSITGFDVNQSTGALTPMAGSPFEAQNSGSGMVATGGYLYAAGGINQQISSYAVGSDGKLTPVGTLAVPTSELIHYGLYAHSSGKFIYAATWSGDILGFQITSPGHLAAISGLPTSIGPDISMTLSPDGKWGFVSYQQTSNGGAHVNTYAINSSTGAWSGPIVYPGSPVGVGNGAPQVGNQPAQVHLTVDPSSSHLFAADPFDNLVFAFRIGSDGSLTAMGNPNGTSSPGAAPYSLAATSSFAYFGDFSMAKLYGYSFSSGALTPTPGSPYANAMAPAYWMAIDPSGHLLYVANNDPGSITVWNIASDGSLSQVSGSPFTTPEMHGNNPSYIVLQ